MQARASELSKRTKDICKRASELSKRAKDLCKRVSELSKRTKHLCKRAGLDGNYAQEARLVS